MSDNKLDFILNRIDNVVEKVDNVNTSLTTHIAKFEAHIECEEDNRAHLARNTDVLHENTASLKEHMNRTNLLEQYVKKIDERFTPVEMEALRKKAVAEWMKSKVIFLGKLGAAITTIGALAGIAKFLIKYLS